MKFMSQQKIKKQQKFVKVLNLEPIYKAKNLPNIYSIISVAKHALEKLKKIFFLI